MCAVEATDLPVNNGFDGPEHAAVTATAAAGLDADEADGVVATHQGGDEFATQRFEVDFEG